VRGSCRICVLSSLNRSLLERACAGRGGVPQCVLWGYGWAVWYALALNKTKWILLLVDCLYYHTILGIVVSKVVLAVVMYCLILSFSSAKEHILNTKVYTTKPHSQDL